MVIETVFVDKLTSTLDSPNAINKQMKRIIQLTPFQKKTAFTYRSDILHICMEGAERIRCLASFVNERRIFSFIRIQEVSVYTGIYRAYHIFGRSAQIETVCLEYYVFSLELDGCESFAF